MQAQVLPLYHLYFKMIRDVVQTVDVELYTCIRRAATPILVTRVNNDFIFDQRTPY